MICGSPICELPICTSQEMSNKFNGEVFDIVLNLQAVVEVEFTIDI